MRLILLSLLIIPFTGCHQTQNQISERQENIIRGVLQQVLVESNLLVVSHEHTDINDLTTALKVKIKLNDLSFMSNYSMSFNPDYLLWERYATNLDGINIPAVLLIFESHGYVIKFDYTYENLEERDLSAFSNWVNLQI